MKYDMKKITKDAWKTYAEIKDDINCNTHEYYTFGHCLMVAWSRANDAKMREEAKEASANYHYFDEHASDFYSKTRPFNGMFMPSLVTDKEEELTKGMTYGFDKLVIHYAAQRLIEERLYTAAPVTTMTAEEEMASWEKAFQSTERTGAM